jgi:hypothetical protein
MAQFASKAGSGSVEGVPPPRPAAPPTQSVAKGAWTFRVESPIEQCVSALLQLAEYVEATSGFSVTDGPRMLSPTEKAERKTKIVTTAAGLKKLADAISEGTVKYSDVEALLRDLQKSGASATNALVSNVARAFVKAGLT